VKTTPTIQKPQSNAGTGEHQIVIVFQADEEDRGFSVISPKGNMIALSLASRLIEARLQREGLLVGAAGSAGELNQGVVSCDVRELAAGLRAVQDELHKSVILSSAFVFFWDQAELVWRSTYPRTGAVFDVDGFVDECIARAKAALKAAGFGWENEGT